MPAFGYAQPVGSPSAVRSTDRCVHGEEVRHVLASVPATEKRFGRPAGSSVRIRQRQRGKEGDDTNAGTVETVSSQFDLRPGGLRLRQLAHRGYQEPF